MTPVQLNEAARRRYSAIGDSFWSDDEVYQLIYDACLELAREAQCIERLYSTTTVSGTQSYDFPTNAMAIKRVTWNGRKLTPIDMRDDDALTGLNQSTTDTGTPEFYWTWNNTMYLRPIPNDAQTLQVWSINFPSTVTNSSTLEIPEQFHLMIVNYVCQQMAAKDQELGWANYYGNLWLKNVADAKSWMKKMKRRDGFATVKDENMIVETYIGGL